VVRLLSARKTRTVYYTENANFLFAFPWQAPPAGGYSRLPAAGGIRREWAERKLHGKRDLPVGLLGRLNQPKAKALPAVTFTRRVSTI